MTDHGYYVTWTYTSSTNTTFSWTPVADTRPSEFPGWED